MTKLNSNQYGFALHTTTSQLGIGISNFVNDNRYQVFDLDRDLATHLHQIIKDFLGSLSWEYLGFLAVAKGPGSFTSTRIGLVTARTLAQQLKIPLFTISTLAALAWSEIKQLSNQALIAVEMKAARGELFVAIYQQAPENLGLVEYLSDCLMNLEEWEKVLDNLTQSYYLIRSSDQLGYTVNSILELAYLTWQQDKKTHWFEALPFYGQHPIQN